MNTPNETQTSRPLGYWLTALDRLMAAEFATAFAAEGITRRDWRALNTIADATPPARPLAAHKLRRLIEHGWVTGVGDTWTLTDEGRSALQRLTAVVETIRARVTDAVPTADLDTTIATLEQLARSFGWDEGMRLPRRAGGRRHHREREHRHGRRHGHGRPHHRGDHPARLSERAYERGFDAGFSRGRDI